MQALVQQRSTIFSLRLSRMAERLHTLPDPGADVGEAVGEVVGADVGEAAGSPQGPSVGCSDGVRPNNVSLVWSSSTGVVQRAQRISLMWCRYIVDSGRFTSCISQMAAGEAQMPVIVSG
jgi:hypothetical protein